MGKMLFNLGFIIFCLGICIADSENLLIPILLVSLGLIVMKITFKKLT